MLMDTHIMPCRDWRCCRNWRHASLQRHGQQQEHVRACHCPPLFIKPAADGLQGAEMLQEVAAVSPHEYERQQKDDLASSGGVRNVAKFVENLAER